MVASWCWGFCDHPDVGIRGALWPESALGPPPLRTLLHLTLVSACGYECVSISGRSLKCPLNVACGEEQGLRRQTGLALRRWPCDLGEVVSLPGPHGCASEQARGKTMGGGPRQQETRREVFRLSRPSPSNVPEFPLLRGPVTSTQAAGLGSHRARHRASSVA